MGVTITRYCIRCHQPAQLKKGMLEGHDVLRCKACKILWIDGDNAPCQDIDDLKRAAEAIRRHNEMMDSDISDPRWTQL